MTTRTLFPVLLLLAVACGSGGGGARPATVAQPEVRLVPPDSIFFGSSQSAPAAIDVVITNHATVPISLRSVELSSPGMVQYGILPVRRTFNQTIAPGETQSVAVFATAVAQGNTRMLGEPLLLRGIITFEGAGKLFREVIQQR